MVKSVLFISYSRESASKSRKKPELKSRVVATSEISLFLRDFSRMAEEGEVDAESCANGIIVCAVDDYDVAEKKGTICVVPQRRRWRLR